MSELAPLESTRFVTRTSKCAAKVNVLKAD